MRRILLGCLSVSISVFAFASWPLPGRAEGSAAAPAVGLVAGEGLLESFALSADRGPVEIQSATLEFEYRSGLLVYKGSVEVNQADLTMSADELRVTLDIEQAGRPREIIALGNVRIVSGERVATGRRAEFDHARQTVTLSGDAVLRDGRNEVSGDKVVVYLDQQRSVVEGGEDRVRAILFPTELDASERESTAPSRETGDGQ